MRRFQAFTLIELSLVLLVLSIVLGGMLTYATRETRVQQWKETQEKLDVIETAILEFRRANGYLPCPAATDVSSEASTFGTAKTSTSSDATTCSGATPLIDGTSTYSVSGDVPVRTLGLSADYAFDGWGWRFTYAVDKRVTLNVAGGPWPLSPNTAETLPPTYLITDTTIGDIIVKNAGGTAITNNALVLVYSHGRNGHGAVNASGTVRTLVVTNADENDNCNCNGALVDNEFVQKLPTEDNTDELNNFDDIVRYKTRWQLYSLDPPEYPEITSF